MELWEIQNQYKIFKQIRPDYSEATRVYNDENLDLDYVVSQTLGGCGFYCPDNDSYLQCGMYQSSGLILWSKCLD